MSIQKIRWSKVYESSEEELMEFLSSRKLQATRIAAEASTEQLQQSSKTDTTIWCAEGSLTLRTDGSSISLQPGDAVRIAADTACDLHAGITGYVCYVSA
jgi:mannose-6-phosphate isomerase class I